MAQSFTFLLFINASEFGVKNGSNSSRSSPVNSIKGYALFCPTPKSQCMDPRVNDVLSKRGIRVVQNQRVTPPQDATFEALEIVIKTDAAKGISIQYADCNLEFVRRIFRIRDVSPLRIKDRRINDRCLNLIKEVLVSRADMPFRSGKNGTLLHFSVERGHVALGKLLLKLGADVNRVTNAGATPVHLAVDRSCRPLFTELLKRGADVNRSKSDGSTPLHSSVDKKNKRIKNRLWFAQNLIKHGADVNSRTKGGFAPLHRALQLGCTQVLRLLLKNGANASTAIKDLSTPLHIAAKIHYKKRESVVHLLLQHGADVHAQDSKGATPMIYFYRSPEILERLIEKGASVDAQTFEGQTVLGQAIQYKCFQSAEYILSLHPNPSVAGNRRAFHIALNRQGEEYVRLCGRMFEEGFTVDPDDVYNPDVLFSTIHKGIVGIAQMLLDNGVDVNQLHQYRPVSHEYMTPLHIAVVCNRADMVQLLLDSGANVNAECDYWEVFRNVRRTPLMSAIAIASLEIVKMLFNANANQRSDPQPLQSALSHGRLEIIEFFLDESLNPNFKGYEGWIFCAPEVIDILAKYGIRFEYHFIYFCKMQFFQSYLDHCPVDVSVLYLRNLRYDSFIFARHFVKMGVIIPDVNAHSVIGLYNDLRGFKEQCKAEAEKLTENIGDTLVRYHDILFSNVHRVACYAKNPSIREAMEPSLIDNRFPIYASIINCKFRMGVWRKTLEEKAVPVLRSLFSQFSRLPDELLDSIARFLSNRDLIVLKKYLPARKS